MNVTDSVRKFNMTKIQARLIRYILKQSIDSGFDCGYDLTEIEAELNLNPKEVFDEDTSSGLLYEYSQYGNGTIHVKDNSASLDYDSHHILSHWADNALKE